MKRRLGIFGVAALLITLGGTIALPQSTTAPKDPQLIDAEGYQKLVAAI